MLCCTCYLALLSDCFTVDVQAPPAELHHQALPLRERWMICCAVIHSFTLFSEQHWLAATGTEKALSAVLAHRDIRTILPTVLTRKVLGLRIPCCWPNASFLALMIQCYEDGTTPLHAAVMAGNLTNTRLLLGAHCWLVLCLGSAFSLVCR